jgi:pyruvate dehydrogenase E2 component (dihydrolipoamide acetyltransferase)
MAEVINMPRLSDTMEEGTVATWLKKVGDKVEEGDILLKLRLTRPPWNLSPFMKEPYSILAFKKAKLQR